jgi:hypothetical protein
LLISLNTTRQFTGFKNLPQASMLSSYKQPTLTQFQASSTKEWFTSVEQPFDHFTHHLPLSNIYEYEIKVHLLINTKLNKSTLTLQES